MTSQKIAGIAWPSMLLVLTGMYAYWATQRELVSSRPSAPGVYDVPDPVPDPGVQTLHSRMWEDPLSTAYADWKRNWESRPKEKRGEKLRTVRDSYGLEWMLQANSSWFLSSLIQDDHKPELTEMQDHFRHLVDKKGSKMLCLPVFLPGGPYAEDKEKRMRIRYSVVTALAESGCQMKHSRRMSYVAPKVFVRVLRGWQEREIVVPVKLYKADSGPWVLVLWINESELGLRPLLATDRILNAIFGAVQKPEQLQVSLVGPASSGTLEWMHGEPGPRNNPHWKIATYSSYEPKDSSVKLKRIVGYQPLLSAIQDGHVNVFSPRATAELDPDNKPEFLKLFRVIGPDSQLAEQVKKELEERGALPGNVVLVTENDTSYGRQIVKTFEKELGTEVSLFPFRILRGIDGNLPGDETSRPRSSSSPQSGSAAPEVVERTPEGRSQYDYLKRLRQQIEQLENVTAIGVVGSDVYDKLLVLRALKPYFPEVVFFTTDLHAIFNHPNERGHTRNLIVASHFGLSLGRELQKETPPFRDSYQTATFLAARLAVQEFELHLLQKRERQAYQLLEAVTKLVSEKEICLGLQAVPSLVMGCNPLAVLPVETLDLAGCSALLTLLKASKTAEVAGKNTLDYLAKNRTLHSVLERVEKDDKEQAQIGPMLHVVGRDRMKQLHNLGDESDVGMREQSVATIVHPSVPQDLGGSHLLFVAGVTLMVICAAFVWVNRDWVHMLVTLKSRNEVSTAEQSKRLRAWRWGLGTIFGTLITTGSVVLWRSSQFDHFSLSGGYNTSARNLLYSATGIFAVLALVYLVGRFVFTLQEESKREVKVNYRAWVTFRMTHTLKAAAMALVVIYAGVLFVNGVSSQAIWTCAILIGIVNLALFAVAWYCKWRDIDRDPDKYVTKNLMLSGNRTQAVKWAAGCVTVFILVSLLAWWAGHPPSGWAFASISRGADVRSGDAMAVTYAFGAIGALLSSLLFTHFWCREFSGYARRVSAQWTNRDDEALDRLRLIGKLTLIPSSLAPVLMGLLLVLVLAYHPTISPTPMPMGLLVVATLIMVLFIASAFSLRLHFDRERTHALEDLQEQHMEFQEQLAILQTDSNKIESQVESLRVQLASSPEDGEADGFSPQGTSKPVDAPVTVGGTEVQTTSTATQTSAQRVPTVQRLRQRMEAKEFLHQRKQKELLQAREEKELLQTRKQQLSDLSEGVFKPWGQTAVGWILGGGTLLALVDLWVRWWLTGA